MPFIEFNNCKIEYEIRGKGEGLILLHGTGQSAQSTWLKTARHLSKHRLVLCPNFSGSGLSGYGDEPLSVSLLAKQVLALADQAGLNKFDLGGHSLGAGVAMHLAAQYPQRVNKLFLLGGFASTKEARMQLQFKLWLDLARNDPLQLARVFLLTAFSPNFLQNLSHEDVEDLVRQIYKHTNWEGAAKQIELDLNFNIVEDIRKITQETLLIACENDYIVPDCHAQELMNLLTNVKYRELRAGHAGPLENLDDFLSLVMDFLAPKGIA